MTCEPAAIAAATGVAILLIALTFCYLADRSEKRRATITSERIESEKAWALSEQVFVEIKPLLSDNDQLKVLRAIYARVKLHMEGTT